MSNGDGDMSQEIATDLKEKLLASLNKAVPEQSKSGLNPSSEASESTVSQSHFKRLAEQVRALNDETEEIEASLNESEVESMAPLDILFPNRAKVMAEEPSSVPTLKADEAGKPFEYSPESEAFSLTWTEDTAWDQDGTSNSPDQDYNLGFFSDQAEPPLDAELIAASERLSQHFEEAQQELNVTSYYTPDVQQVASASEVYDYSNIYEGKEVVLSVSSQNEPSPHSIDISSETTQQQHIQSQNPVSSSPSIHKGGSMADLSGYKDLSKAPTALGEPKFHEEVSPLVTQSFRQPEHHPTAYTHEHTVTETNPAAPALNDPDLNGNFQTLIRLINELPEGVTKQTGAQIIRLTMESMGIFMEDVLSDAQAAQAEMLDAVRANIKKIEEYKSIIRKLETDIKYYQSKANELSEIIDLFILSNPSSRGGSIDEYTSR